MKNSLKKIARKQKLTFTNRQVCALVELSTSKDVTKMILMEKTVARLQFIRCKELQSFLKLVEKTKSSLARLISLARIMRNPLVTLAYAYADTGPLA